MNLCVVSPFPPEISGMGQYGWNMVQGLARTGRFQAITVLAGGRPRVRAPAPLTPLASPVRPPGRSATTSGAEAGSQASFHGSVVTTRHVWTRDDLRSAPRLMREIRAGRPDLVWFNLGFAVFGSSRSANFLGLALPMLTRRAGIPTVVTLHEIYEAVHPGALGMRNGRITAWGAQAATRMLLQADGVCVTLRRYVQELRRRYGAHNVWHVPLGALAPPEILPRPTTAPPRDILMFATFAPYKGMPVLLKAFEHLRARDPEVTLTVAGSDHPRFPGYLASLRASVRGTRAEGMRWLGPQPEPHLRDLFAQASVVVLPYTATTGASSVLYRAAAFGRPVIMSDLPDLRAVAEEEDLWAEYAPPGDAAALAAALGRLLSDPDRQAAIAQHNLERLQAMTLDHTCAKYVALFEQVADRRP